MLYLYIALSVVFVFLSVFESGIADRSAVPRQAYWALYALTASFALAAVFCPALDGGMRRYAFLTVFRWLYRAAWAFLLGVGAFAAVYPYLPFARRADGTETLMIVLGAPVLEDRPTRNLLSRADRTAQWIAAHPETDVILSGGKPSGRTEAQTMLDRLREKGAPDQRIYLEEQSDNTQSNLSFSKKLAELLGHSGADPVAVVTNDFHCLRMRYYARDAGFRDVRCVPAPTATQAAPIWIFAEALLLIQYRVLKHN